VRIGLLTQKRSDGREQMWNRLLITTKATDGKSAVKHQLRIGERVHEIVSGETNNQKETNQ